MWRTLPQMNPSVIGVRLPPSMRVTRPSSTSTSRSQRSGQSRGQALRSRVMPAPYPARSGVEGRAQEPRVLLELGDDAGEDVDGVGVAELLAERARLSYARQVALDPVGEEPHVVEIAAGLLRVLRQARHGGDVPRGAEGEAPE